MRARIFLGVGLATSAITGMAIGQISLPQLQIPQITIQTPRIPTPDEAVNEFNKRIKQTEDGLKTVVEKGKEAVDRAADQGKSVAEQAKQELENAGAAVSQGLKDLAANGKKAVEDYYRNLAKSANDLVEAAQTVGRFIEREVSGYGQTLSSAEKRIRQGKIVDAVWHLYTEPLQNTSEHAAAAAAENELIGQSMAAAATFYGGPAGSAAYSAWFAYQRTGNADMAIRVGIAAGVQSYVSAQAGAMPSGAAGELAKKALVTGAAGGIAVAASGGDDAAVREAFLRQGGMVMMQGGKSYITKKFDAAAGQIDSFCTSSTGTTCKPLLEAVQRDENGNIILDEKGLPKIDTGKVLATRAELGNWTNANIPKVSKNLPGIGSSLTILKNEWAISWDKTALTNKSVNAPAVAITYIGPASPYARKVEELNIAIGKQQVRTPAQPIPVQPTREFWVALGDVGTRETFFKRMFVRSNEALSVGDIVRATTSVNARPHPRPTGTPYVLPPNALIVIGEIREVPIPRFGTTQRWARLDLDVD